MKRVTVSERSDVSAGGCQCASCAQGFVTLHPDASADPFAGTVAPNNKLIWTEQQAAANLNRTGASWAVDNYGVLDDGVLTYGFWNSFEQIAASYYVTPDGSVAFDEVFYGEDFSVFTAGQRVMADRNIQAWDDLVSIRIDANADAANADITYANTYTGPSSGAYAYLPLGDEVYSFYDDTYGFEDAGRLGGDVWINGFYAPNLATTATGSYAYFTVLHETGHALGLSHPGDYNASDDDDGDGTPDPITYQGDAYFFQDSNQYTIMSYFGEDVTGASWVDFQNLAFTYAMTPMVHDVLAVQEMYGADMTTRTGDTTYGFNSNAGRDVFDFTKTASPVVTIWDAGGTDTLDFSGFNTDEVINLNQGAFSSASKGATLDYLKSIGFVPASYTQAQLTALFASYGNGAQGQMTDNIAIAYGAVIENATAGGGNDLLIANEVANVLKGGAGIDTASYRDAGAAVTASLANDRGARGDAAGDSYIGIERLEGSAFGDTLTGGNRDDGLVGLAGNDTLSGGNGRDVLSGGDGDDRLDGGNGVDTLDGGAGVDILDGGNDGDTMSGGDGNDRLSGGNGRDTMDGGAGNDTLDGGNDDDVLTGGLGDDRIDAGNGRDTLNGGAGRDILIGGNDDDRFLGGAGADTMTGGNGRDVFVFADLGDTDTITDFRGREDKIDVSDIDAVAGGGLDAFRWIGSAAFSGAAGELHTYTEGRNMFLSGDVNGDKIADFVVALGQQTVVQADIIFV